MAQHFSVEGIYNIVASKDGYTGTGDLNRLTAIQTINEKFSVQYQKNYLDMV